MQDPFELHPDHPPFEKKKKKFLTLSQVNDTIDIKIKSLENTPVGVWGFSRRDIIEVLETVKRELVDKCQKD